MASFHEIAQELDATRLRRSQLLQERRALALAPVAKSDVASRIKALLDNSEATARRAFVPDGLIRHAPDDEFIRTDAGLPEVFRSSPLGALCLLGFRAAVEKVLLAEAAKVATGRSYTTSEREAEGERLADAIADCEIAEEHLIREAEAAGFDLLRRPDADPALFLLEEMP